MGIQEELREVSGLFDLSPLYRRTPWADLLLAETLVGLLYLLHNLTTTSRGCSHCGNYWPIKVEVQQIKDDFLTDTHDFFFDLFDLSTMQERYRDQHSTYYFKKIYTMFIHVHHILHMVLIFAAFVARIVVLVTK